MSYALANKVGWGWIIDLYEKDIDMYDVSDAFEIGYNMDCSDVYEAVIFLKHARSDDGEVIDATDLVSNKPSLLEVSNAYTKIEADCPEVFKHLGAYGFYSVSNYS